MQNSPLVLIMHPLKIVRTAIKSILANNLSQLAVYEHDSFDLPLPLYNGQLPGLLITDVYYEVLMPSRLLEGLAEKYQHLKVIATSNHAVAKNDTNYRQNVTVLSKKASEQELVAAINKCFS